MRQTTLWELSTSGADLPLEVRYTLRDMPNLIDYRETLIQPEFRWTVNARMLNAPVWIGKASCYTQAEYGSDEDWYQSLFETSRPFNNLIDNGYLEDDLAEDYLHLCSTNRDALLTIDGSRVNGIEFNDHIYDHAVHFNSPVIRIEAMDSMPFQDAIVEMTKGCDKKTRYKARAAASLVETDKLSYVVTDSVDLGYIVPSLAKRWGPGDWTQALGQVLYAKACPNTIAVWLYSDVADVCNAYRVFGNCIGIALLLTNNYRGSPYYELQAVVHNGYSDIGRLLTLAAMQSAAQYAINFSSKEAFIDPSCVTSPFNPHSIDIYKREFVNTSNTRYCWLLDSDEDGGYHPPYYIKDKGWIGEPQFINAFPKLEWIHNDKAH